MHGVKFIEAPQNWQIYQHINGNAEIQFRGIFEQHDNLKNIKIWIRVVSEDTGINIVPWTKIKIGAKNSWSGKIKIPIGGLYRIESSMSFTNFSTGTATDILPEYGMRGDIRHHIGIGDLYVIAGQSNSVGYAREPINDSPQIGISVRRYNGCWDLASHPLHDATDTKTLVNMEWGNPAVSPYLNFAKIIYQNVKYPIGLIPTALGGSPLSRWNPAEKGDLYSAMLSILKTCGKIKAMLWYQGCSDTEPEQAAKSYGERFANMVKEFRKEMKILDLPIFTYQINRFHCIGLERTHLWAMLKETQRIIPKKIKNVFVMSTNDCICCDAIHINSVYNIELGLRLANQVLGELYGKNKANAPDIASAKLIAKNKVELTFSNVKNNIYCFEMNVSYLPFTIEDKIGKLKICDYKLNKNKIIIETDRAIGADAVVHGAHSPEPFVMIPIDRESKLPMLSFYNFKITEH